METSPVGVVWPPRAPSQIPEAKRTGRIAGLRATGRLREARCDADRLYGVGVGEQAAS
ncbi:MAG: hypothetical protein HW418_2328 [Anaerolineales bacterium]|nr:hypothetical protein [Anaerolineales bacterium]